MSAPTVLRLGYGTSRGRDTYGYTIVRLVDETAGRTFRCMGGGYDMVGTVLADWATATHQDRLVKLADRAYYVSGTGPGVTVNDGPDSLYGLWRYEYGDAVPIAPVRVSIDGGSGLSSVERILTAAGIKLTRTFVATGRNRGTTTGWIAELAEGDVK